MRPTLPLLAVLALAVPASASAAPAGGEAEGSASASLGGGASSSGEADATPSDETTSTADAEPSRARYTEPGRDRGRDRDKWIYRWAPQRNMGEIGVFGGVWFPSRHLELFEPVAGFPDDGHQLLRVVTPEIGVRAGYYPLRFLGVEVDAGVMPTRTLGTGGRATAWALRGSVVGQLGLWSVTPFLLAGTGMLGSASPGPPDSIGSEQDVVIHFGGGVKVYVNRWILLRLDVRNVVSNRLGVGEGLTSSPEILLGLSVTLGRKKEPRPRPGAADRDGDRILDRDDYCPDLFGPPPRGCPQVCVDDTDADGLIDPEDKCPTEPESRNGFEDADGCPDEVPPELADLSGVMEGINFDTDKDTIKPASKPRIDQAVEVMQKYPDLRVRISGHTDSVGGYRHNVDLSKRRAKSVKKYMVDNGIAEDRIETEGFGPDQPIDTNETTEGRARNRRIEFMIIEQDAGAKIETKP